MLSREQDWSTEAVDCDKVATPLGRGRGMGPFEFIQRVLGYYLVLLDIGNIEDIWAARVVAECRGNFENLTQLLRLYFFGGIVNIYTVRKTRHLLRRLFLTNLKIEKGPQFD